MSVATKDGPWLSITTVVRLDCSKCGTVLTTTRPQNEREQDTLIREHAREHGGIYR